MYYIHNSADASPKIGFEQYQNVSKHTLNPLAERLCGFFIAQQLSLASIEIYTFSYTISNTRTPELILLLLKNEVAMVLEKSEIPPKVCTIDTPAVIPKGTCSACGAPNSLISLYCNTTNSFENNHYFSQNAR